MLFVQTTHAMHTLEDITYIFIFCVCLFLVVDCCVVATLVELIGTRILHLILWFFLLYYDMTFRDALCHLIEQYVRNKNICP